MRGTTYPIVFGLGFARQVDAAASLSGESNLTAAAVRVADGLVSLSGETALSAAAITIAFADVSMSGFSDATFTATAERPGDVNLIATSSLSADGVRITFADAAFASQSDLVANAQAFISSTADLSAEATLDVAGTVVQPADVAMSAESDLVIGDPHYVWFGQVNMSGGATNLTASADTLYHLLPVTYDGSISFDYLFGRVQYKQSYSVLVKDGVAFTTTDPAQENLSNYDQYFLGGRKYQIDQATAAILQASDLGEYVEVG